MLSPPQVLIASQTSASILVASSEDEDEDDSDKEIEPLDYLELDSEQNIVSLLDNYNYTVLYYIGNIALLFKKFYFSFRNISKFSILLK